MKKLLPFACLAFIPIVMLPADLMSKDELQIGYHMGWDRPNSHLLDITMTIGDVTGEKTDVRIPAWRPGRYIIQNYAKNIVSFVARNDKGVELPTTKLDKGTWRIDHKGSKRLVISYQYYARELDAGSSFLDDSEAYINPITCLMYVPGAELLPVTLTLQLPEGWRLAGALEFDASRGVFASDNYHELADTPILLSPSFRLLTFEHKGAAYEIALQGEGNYDEEKIIADIKKIVIDQTDMMQDVPFERYLFMYHLLPYRFGHGVEHKNSTSIVIGPVDFDDEKFYRGFLGVTAHEFFHVWNVERIRPEAIYQPDYSKENYTTTMWIYEGFTSYYGGLSLVRTRLEKQSKYLKGIAGAIKRYELNYGRNVSSVEMVSWDSWTKSKDPPPNSYYSFYTAGQILGLLLDLEIRNRTGNDKSLDDVMRYLNKEYAQKHRGVPEDGLQRAIERVSGSSFERFFEAYVSGTEKINYNEFLNHAGLELVVEQDDKSEDVHMGVRVRGDEKQTEIANVVPGSPAYLAGLDRDDILLAIEGRRAHAQNLTLLLKGYSPGDTIAVSVFRRARLRDFYVVLGEPIPDKYEVKKLETPTDTQLAIRKSWLNSTEDEETRDDEETTDNLFH